MKKKISCPPCSNVPAELGANLRIVVDEVQLYVRQDARTVVDLVHRILQGSGYGPALHQQIKYNLMTQSLKTKTKSVPPPENNTGTYRDRYHSQCHTLFLLTGQ